MGDGGGGEAREAEGGTKEAGGGGHEGGVLALGVDVVVGGERWARDVAEFVEAV